VQVAAQHSTAQHSTAQHSTAQHSTAQHSTAQHSTAQHSTSLGWCPTAMQSTTRNAVQHACAAAACLHEPGSHSNTSKRPGTGSPQDDPQPPPATVVCQLASGRRCSDSWVSAGIMTLFTHSIKRASALEGPQPGHVYLSSSAERAKLAIDQLASCTHMNHVHSQHGAHAQQNQSRV
jgi:hypothetical protein